jgi:hypothetical protein
MNRNDLTSAGFKVTTALVGGSGRPDTFYVTNAHIQTYVRADDSDAIATLVNPPPPQEPQ